MAPVFTKPEEEYESNWQLKISGDLGIQFVDYLRKHGAWDAIDDPIDVKPYLDGQHAFIIARRPNMPFCSSQSFTGAVYESGARGIDLMGCISDFSEQSPAQIRRRQIFDRVRSAIGVTPKYGG